MATPKLQRLLETKPTTEEVILVPLLITYQAIRSAVITLAPIALTLLLVFTPFAIGSESPEPVMFVTTASAERAQSVISTTKFAEIGNSKLPTILNPFNKKIFLDQAPNSILVRMCEMRGIEGVHQEDREGMINRLIQS